jgi:hypothetical protein
MDAKVLWSVALLVSLLVFFFLRLNGSRNKTADATTGFALWQSFDNFFDFVIYPVAIAVLGPVNGFVTMFVVTLVINLVYMVINKTTDVDWTFIEHLNQLGWVRKVRGWRIGSFEPATALIFLAISAKIDSFTAMTFLDGKQINVKTIRFWVLLLISHTIANGLWTVGWELLFTAVRNIT